MPVIAFIQPKGGVGKSTSALLLATELARGTTVTVIDADPNAPIVKWQERGGQMPNLTITAHTQEDTILDAIEAAAQQSAFVIVDTEGTANFTAAKAAVMADLVVIPTRGSALDQDNAAKAIKFVREAERISRRTIPCAVLFTCVSAAIRSKGVRAAEAQLTQHSIAVFASNLIEREAFRAIFAYSTMLAHLNPAQVSGLEKACANSRALAEEVVQRLSSTSDRKAPQQQAVPV